MNVSEYVEEQAYFAGIDYTICIIALLGSLSIGIYFGFFSKDIKYDDFLVGGRKMKVIPIAISLVSR